MTDLDNLGSQRKCKCLGCPYDDEAADLPISENIPIITCGVLNYITEGSVTGNVAYLLAQCVCV